VGGHCPFDEKLFIDNINTDWALRARAKGQRLYGVTNTRFDHTFGETTLTVSPFGLRRQFLLCETASLEKQRNLLIISENRPVTR
jgi:GT2 family glycosyltransferase